MFASVDAYTKCVPLLPRIFCARFGSPKEATPKTSTQPHETKRKGEKGRDANWGMNSFAAELRAHDGVFVVINPPGGCRVASASNCSRRVPLAAAVHLRFASF
jgi:hypothetical protein